MYYHRNATNVSDVYIDRVPFLVIVTRNIVA